MKKNCKRLIKKNLEYKKYLRKKMVNYILNGKVTIIHLLIGLIKRFSVMLSYKNESIFSKLYEPFGGDINVKVDLSNYATKADIKNISHVDTSSFALKTNLANSKTEVDKLDID